MADRVSGWVAGWVGRLWAASSPLTAVGLAMLLVFAASSVGVAVDGRMIAGSRAWLKPAKFAISTAAYCLTLAWIFAALPSPSGTIKAAGLAIAAVLALEVCLIDVQAARGTTSHFNVATGFDAAVFAAMGLGILTLLVASATIAVLLFREPFADRATGWAIRLGMLVAVVGSTTGGLMLRPTPSQLTPTVPGRAPSVVGGHTVGGPDGGPSLPGTGWSLDHGDLRVPHFFGLHAIQAIPLLAWLALRATGAGSDRARVAIVAIVAASYALLIVGLTLQALAGVSAVATDPRSLAAWLAWLATTLLALAFVTFATVPAPHIERI